VTFLGGMGLSQLMTHGDLALVVMVHWLGTFLNTPVPPAERNLPGTLLGFCTKCGALEHCAAAKPGLAAKAVHRRMGPVIARVVGSIALHLQ